MKGKGKSLNELYAEYAALRGREHVETALKSKQMEIATSFFEIVIKEWRGRENSRKQEEYYIGDNIKEIEAVAFFVKSDFNPEQSAFDEDTEKPQKAISYPYGEQLFDSVKDSLNSFSGNCDEFEKYLRGVLKRKIGTASENEDREKKNGGMKIPHKKIQTVRSAYRFQKSMHPNLDEDALVGKTTEFLHEVKGMKRINKETVQNILEYDNTVNFDDVAEQYPREDTAELSAEDEKNVAEKTTKGIEKIFQCVQEIWKKKRQRELISKIYTRSLIEKDDVDIELLSNLSERFEFLDKEIIQLYIDNKNIPSQRDLGADYGETEENTAQILKRFKNKIEKALEPLAREFGLPVNK